MKNCLKIQNISINAPQHRIKNETNFDNFTYENSELIAAVEQSDVDFSATKMNSNFEKVNDTNLKTLKSAQVLEKLAAEVLQMKKDVLELQSSSLVSKISNSTDINEVRSLVHRSSMSRSKNRNSRTISCIEKLIWKLKTLNLMSRKKKR